MLHDHIGQDAQAQFHDQSCVIPLVVVTYGWPEEERTQVPARDLQIHNLTLLISQS